MLDPQTALLLTAALAGVGGLLFYREWRANPSQDSLLWWAVSLGLAATSFLLFAAGSDEPQAWPRMLGNYVTLGAAGAAYSGVRRLNGSSPNLLMLVLGPTLWLALGAKLGSDFGARVTAISSLHAAYAFAMAFELLRRSKGRAVELRIAAGVMIVVGSGHLLRAVTGPNFRPADHMDPGMTGAWVTPMALASVLYVAALVVLIIRATRKDGQMPDPERAPVTESRSRQSL